MKRHKLLLSVRLVFVAALALSFGISQIYAQGQSQKDKELKFKGEKSTTAEK